MDKVQLGLIRGYMEKALRKLAVAKELLSNQHFDDAVSRAYYAAFHAAQAALLTEGQQAESHKGVTTLFGLLLVKSGKVDRRCGRILASLKDNRESGDYEALSFIDAETAARAVQEADYFCSAVRQFLVSNNLIE